MKIGIITLEIFWVHRNVGTLLQNFSLVETLNELGHDARSISRFFRMRPQWHKPKKPYKNKFDAIKKFFVNPKKFLREYEEYRHVRYYEYERPLSFKKFYDTYVKKYEGFYNRKSLLESPPEADCYICGSDQVWTPDDRPEVFLDFAPKGKRISYAVSRPWVKTSDNWLRVVGKEISHFAGVSVREEEGIQVMNKAGCTDVVVTIDPVMLHDADWYTTKLKLTNKPGNYLLLYVLNITSLDLIPFNDILDYCKQNQLELKVVASQGAENVIPRQYLQKADPVEFLNLVKNAKCLVTNSFHGCVFSYVFQRPFAAMLQEGKTVAENARFMTLLNRCNETYRIVNKNNVMDNFTNLLNKAPSEAQAKIEEWRNFSISFIQNSLAAI